MSNDEIVPLLAEGNIGEDISQNIDTRNACQQTRIRPQISLPPGKEYHIFISYSSSDHAYALSLKNVLEGLGFKCMLADHDFIAGVSIMRNIERSIETSHKLLLVVSQHFLQSQFCDREVDIAHKYAADNDRHDFMIVLRLDESKMPLKLDYMTYVNGVDLEVEDVGRKVEEAFYGLADVPLSQRQNGREILRKRPLEKAQRMCCSASYEFNDIDQFEWNALVASSMEGSAECYREIKKCANDHFLLNRYAVFNSSRKLIGFHLLLSFGILTLFASMYLFFLQLTGSDVSSGGIFLIIMVLPVLNAVLHIACALHLFRRVMHKLYSVVLKNTDCKSQNYLVLPRRHRNSIFNYLEQRAREHWPTDSEEDIAKKCNNELVTTILNSFIGLDLNPIPKAAIIRHDTDQQRCCICQLAKSPWTHKDTIARVKPDQGKESNSNEETCVMKIAGTEIENENPAIGHRMYSTTENHETGIKNVFAIDDESIEENDETYVMKIACSGQDSKSSKSPGTTSLTGTGGDSPVTGTSEEPLLDPNTDRWHGGMYDSHVRGEATQQHQVSQELITLEDNPLNLSDSEMSTPSNVLGEVATLPSEDEERQCFRGEYCIDEETQAKVHI